MHPHPCRGGGPAFDILMFGRPYQPATSTCHAHNAYRRIGLGRHFMHFALELTRIMAASYRDIVSPVPARAMEPLPRFDG
jgi:hypothetical protein